MPLTNIVIIIKYKLILESRNSMNEKKKLITLLSIVGIISLTILISIMISGTKGDKLVKQVENALESKQAKIIYLGRPTCSYCSLLKPVLDRYSKKYEFTFEYINTDELSNAKLKQILNILDVDYESFGTPYLAIVKNGKKIKEQEGYVSDDKLFAFFKESGFIGKDENLSLNYIDYNTYKEKLENGSKEIFTMIQTGCSHCEEAKPVLEEIAEEYKVTFNVLNITDFENDDDKNNFMNSLPYYNENQWGTPLTLIVQDKNVIDKIEGFESKEKYIEFLKKNGFIEG